MKKILLTGSDGLLGGYIYKNIANKSEVIKHSRKHFDLCDKDKLYQEYNSVDIKTIIHCAAYTDVKNSNIEHRKVFLDNILASVNLIDFAYYKACRFVFISTDFVFDGSAGNYSALDKINPLSVYAKSKASIEFALSCHPDSLIIRTSFYGEYFPFDCGCTDRYTSKDYIDIIAPKIYEQAIGTRVGLMHIGTEKKSYYELGKRRKDVSPVQCLEKNLFNKDHSFNYED